MDRAYVMADPSMDRQEFYVAASRSREETWFYATPEIQVEREEYAPRSPHLREGLEHIAEAAERNGAQGSAHDQAMRSSLGKLPSEELARRRDELRAEAGAEEANQQARRHLGERLAETEARLGRIEGDRRDLGEPPAGWRRRDQRQAHAEEARRIDATASMSREAAERMRAELGASSPVDHQARAELAVIDHLLAERERAALAAVRVSTPDYVLKELGERPVEAARRATWDEQREGSRVTDNSTASGTETRRSGRSRAIGRRGGRGSKQPIRSGGHNDDLSWSRYGGSRGREAWRSSYERNQGSRAGRIRATDRRGGRPSRGAADDRRRGGATLHVPRSTLYELVRSQGLPHVRIGSRGFRFTRSDLARWVRENSYGS